MDTQQIEQIIHKVVDTVIPLAILVGGQILGALALWIVGRIIIGALRRAIRHTGERRKLDPTLIRYIDSMVGITLQVLLVVAVLGVFGVQTTTFAGVIAAAGVAIGMAWSGLLSNFAAGFFLIALSPFKVGDRVQVGNVVGSVAEIGLFVTSVDTDDGVRVYVGNTKVFGDNIWNFSANAHRRVDMAAQLAHGVDPQDAIKRLKQRLAEIPDALKDPAPQVEIDKFNMAGTVLLVRCFTHDRTYWNVYFAMSRAIASEFTLAGYPTPAEHFVQLSLPNSVKNA